MQNFKRLQLAIVLRRLLKSWMRRKSPDLRIYLMQLHCLTDMFIVVLMSIYDKSEMENVSDAYLKNILKEAKRLA